MGCVCLLGSAHLLRTQTQVRRCHLHFLFHFGFHMVFVFFITVTTENPDLQGSGVIRRNVAQINVETVTTVSCSLWMYDRYHCVPLEYLR